jgi:dTDP-4-dehydrorhamnose reductase
VKLLITGGAGMLALALSRRLGSEHEIVPFGREDLDVTAQPRVREALRSVQPEAVLHCAAWTDVDGCEGDPVRALRVNGSGAGHIASAAAALGVPVVHFSTDYVFDGSAVDPYREEDEPRPINAYGRSKLAGEVAVRDAADRHFILRTSGLFGIGGRSFPAAILDAARAGRPLDVVSDQCLAPTYAPHLADGVARVLSSDRYGTYHVTSSGRADWFTYAGAILEEAGLRGVALRPISTEASGRAAPRPAFSVLDTGRFQKTFGWTAPGWREGLREFLGEVGAL